MNSLSLLTVTVFSKCASEIPETQCKSFGLLHIKKMQIIALMLPAPSTHTHTDTKTNNNKKNIKLVDYGGIP